MNRNKKQRKTTPYALLSNPEREIVIRHHTAHDGKPLGFDILRRLAKIIEVQKSYEKRIKAPVPSSVLRYETTQSPEYTADVRFQKKKTRARRFYRDLKKLKELKLLRKIKGFGYVLDEEVGK